MRVVNSILRMSLLCLLALCPDALISAQEPTAGRPSPSIWIRGKDESVVTNTNVLLSDIAECSSPTAGQEKALIALQNILVDRCPVPGETTVIGAGRVLDLIRASGIDPDQIGYSFPQVMRVKRAGREIQEIEIRSALESYFEMAKKDILIRTIQTAKPVVVPPGEVTLSVTGASAPRYGHSVATLVAKTKDNSELTFEVNVNADEWLSMPVANRSISKGSVIDSRDVMMARLNLSALPKDAANEPQSIIGLKLSEDMTPGEVFRRGKLALPTVIAAGSRVTLLFRQGLLEATASGTALESAAQGQGIRVRNESSKKTVSGTVIEPGLVEVTP